MPAFLKIKGFTSARFENNRRKKKTMCSQKHFVCVCVCVIHCTIKFIQGKKALKLVEAEFSRKIKQECSRSRDLRHFKGT